MKLVHWTFGVCLFTASCDLILNFNLGGSFRLAQVLMIAICLAALARALQHGRILWPRGATPLFLWLLVQIVFLPFSGDWSIGLKFLGLLLFTIFGILAIVQLYGQSPMIEKLMKIYMASFVFVAAYGLLQFGLPLVGITAPLTAQWFVHGRLARINGFSFEPSYFATYMSIGWIMLVDLRISKARIAHGAYWKWATVAVTAAMFCAASKTGWVIMLLELLARLAPPVWRSLKRLFGHGKLLVRIPLARILLYSTLLAIGGLAASQYLEKYNVTPSSFLQGSGLGGTAAHSINDRGGDLMSTLAAFEDSPFVGRSIGGVAVYRAARIGIKVTTMEDVRQYWGFPVILDVLVASGAIGIIPFLVFIYSSTFGGIRLARHYWPEERAKWLRALARAMIFEWLTLMADQNLLRVYLWFHFAMIMVVAYHLEFAPAPVPEPHKPKRSYFSYFEVPAAL